MSVYKPEVKATLSCVFDGFGGPDSEPTIVQIIPKSATVHLNSYKEADTFEMTFDAKSLPFSPELIRAVGVELYAYDAGATPGAQVANDVALGTVGRSASGFATADNLLVTGLADNCSLSISSSGREFKLDGRDYTALMLDKQWDQRRRLNVGLPIDEVVRQLVDEATQSARVGRTLNVLYQVAGQTPGSNRGQERRTKRGKPIRESKSYWDIIYELCIRQGLICFVRGWDVIITNPQTLTKGNSGATRRMVYGKNLSSLDVERKIGKERVPQIVVRSWDPKTRKTLEARFPTAKAPAKTGIGTERDEIRAYTVRDVTSERVLRDIAESTYNDLARGEATTRFTTKDLRDTQDASLLLLRSGDSVTVAFDPFGDPEMRTMGYDQRNTYLLSQGYSRSISALVAEEYDRIDQFRTPQYVREMSVSWGTEEGLSLDVECVNFISPERDDVSSVAGKFAMGGVESGLPELPDEELL